MRVLFVAFEYGDLILGGLGRVVNGLKDGLRRAIDVDVYHLYFDFSRLRFSAKLYRCDREGEDRLIETFDRGAVASIRAVNVDSVVRTLLSRGLITEVSTQAETGAILYGTTDMLLTQLGINSLEELPKISPLLDDGSDGFDEIGMAR